MRKLIFGGIVFVLAMVVWKLYLDYETKQFIQNLPRLPESELRQVDSPLEPVPTTSLNTESNAVMADMSEDTSDTSVIIITEIANTPVTDSVFENTSLEQLPEPDETRFPSELEKLFSAYYPIHEEVTEISKVLRPLLDQHLLGSRRIREILLNDLPASVDGPKRQALYAEMTEIEAWNDEVEPTIFELHDKRTLLSNERSTLLATYGISSYHEFDKLHGNAYEVWKTE
ncbi:MAG: hypothetical protein F4039_10625 [Gammaproteobacteria bacterium]|nr:hypothetical protein [Gammaproteobacteria bacterium]